MYSLARSYFSMRFKKNSDEMFLDNTLNNGILEFNPKSLGFWFITIAITPFNVPSLSAYDVLYDVSDC